MSFLVPITLTLIRLHFELLTKLSPAKIKIKGVVAIATTEAAPLAAYVPIDLYVGCLELISGLHAFGLYL